MRRLQSFSDIDNDYGTLVGFKAKLGWLKNAINLMKEKKMYVGI
jgi:hypothetical protein